LKVAALDLGTNTFLCLIAEVEGGRVSRVISDTVKVVRLGEGVHQSRRLADTALARADECLRNFKVLIETHGVTRVGAVATSAARDASNGHKLFELGNKYSIPIKTISGPTEAELSFQGIVSDRADVAGLMGLDIGGGSTEVMGVEDGKVFGTSVDIGAVRLTEMFVTKNPVSDGELEKIDDFARSKMNVFSGLRPKELVAAAGTPTTLAALDQGIDFIVEKIHGYKMPSSKIDEWLQRLARMTIEERVALRGLDSGRADVIVAGLVILKAACDILDVDQITVSVRGIRFGLAVSLARGEF
jgi:exopolyphosphatase / guanosine-5'-triphosphate,3'-diphosphate pyrophosphatase